MKKQTFISNMYHNGDLAYEVIRQIGGWKEFKEIASDVANHGADGGFSGFIYYQDTMKFAKKNLKIIMESISELATDVGYDSSFAMIADFNCLKMKPEEVAAAIYDKKNEDRQTVLNALAWYALEEVCRAYDDMKNN